MTGIRLIKYRMKRAQTAAVIEWKDASEVDRMAAMASVCKHEWAFYNDVPFPFCRLCGAMGEVAE